MTIVHVDLDCNPLTEVIISNVNPIIPVVRNCSVIAAVIEFMSVGDEETVSLHFCCGSHTIEYTSSTLRIF